MSPEEAELLQKTGKTLLEDVSSIVALMFLYGMYVLLLGMTVQVVLERRKKQGTLSRPSASWILLITLGITFVIISFYCAMYIAIDITTIQGNLTGNLPVQGNLEDRLGLTVHKLIRGGMFTGKDVVGSTGGIGLLCLISDAVVAWRALSICPERRLPHAFIIGFLLLTTLALWAATLGLYLRSFYHNSLSAYDDALSGMEITSLVLSITINVYASALIGVKAYRHRKMLKRSIGVSKSTTVGTLLFITESGIAYALLQIIGVSIGLTDTYGKSTASLHLASILWSNSTMVISAIYPTVVVLIVAKQCSIKRTIQISQGLSSESGSTPPVHGTHMSFVSPETGAEAITVDVEVAKDDESESIGTDVGASGSSSATEKL